MRNLPATSVAAFALFVLPATSLAQGTIPPNDGSTPGLDLTSLDIQTLLNMRVTTASRFSEKLSDAPGIMSVVTSDEIRRFGYVTLGEVLQRVPGFARSTQYFVDRSLVAARGDQMNTNGSHILFLINGRPTREMTDGGVISDLLESFPVDALDRIEVIRGPGSVLYGSNAFSAVVNLITLKSDANRLGASALLGASGALSSTAHATYTRGDVRVAGAAQVHNVPDWSTIYMSPPSQRNLPFAPHVPDAQNISVRDNGAGGYVGLNYKGLSVMSAFTEWRSTGFILGNVSQTHMTRNFANLGYDHKATENWDMTFNLTYTGTTFDAPNQLPNVVRDSHEIVGEWTNLIRLTAKDRLAVGALVSNIAGVEQDTVVTPSLTVMDGSRPGGSFYAQLDHQLRDDVKLIGGFQTNKVGNNAINTVPRVGVIWAASSAVSVKALYGEAFRAPSLDELLLDHPGLGGNPDLRPESVATFDLGLGYQGRRAQAGIDYFHSKQTDTITTVLGVGRFHYVNFGEVTFNGVTVEGKYYLRDDFFVEGSALYQKNEDGFGETNVAPTSPYGFKVGASYQSAHGLTVSLFDASDSMITAGLAGSANPIQGAHHIMNGHLRYDLSRHLGFSDRKSVAVVVHATNLADHQVWLPGGFKTPDLVPVQQGRVVYAGLQVALGGN